MSEKGVKQIICGGMGARAEGLFKELDIETVVGIEGSINEVIEELEKGALEGRESLCAPGAGKGYGVEKDECDHEHD